MTLKHNQPTNLFPWHSYNITTGAASAAVAEWLSSWLTEQEDRDSIPGLATWIFWDWLSPASKLRYGWKIAKSTLILKTTNQPTNNFTTTSYVVPLANKRPKGPHIVHLSTMCNLFWGIGQGWHFCLLIGPKNTNLVEDVEILLPVTFTWIPFSGFRGEVENVSAHQRPGRPSCFSDRPEKHKLGRGRWNLASCQVSLNSIQWFHWRSRKCEKLTTDRRTTDNAWSQ